MKPLTIAESETIILGLQDEIRRSEESRYDHRLHGVLLVAQGMTCPEVGRLLGDAPRSVEYWVRRFEERGLAGLSEGQRSGRPRRLSEAPLQDVGPARNQGSHPAPPSHPEECRLLRGYSLARRPILFSARDGQVQRRNLLAVLERPACGQHPHGSAGGGDCRQCEVPPRPTSPGMEGARRRTLRLRLLAALQSRVESHGAGVETHASTLSPPPLFSPVGRSHSRGRNRVRQLDQAEQHPATTMRNYLRRCV